MDKALLKRSAARGELGKAVAAGGEMVETASGLVVPADAVPDKRTRRVWDWQVWKNTKRMIRFFAGEDITMVLGCSKCKQVLRPIPEGNGYNLECACKVREIRPGR